LPAEEIKSFPAVIPADSPYTALLPRPIEFIQYFPLPLRERMSRRGQVRGTIIRPLLAFGHPPHAWGGLQGKDIWEMPRAKSRGREVELLAAEPEYWEWIPAFAGMEEGSGMTERRFQN